MKIVGALLIGFALAIAFVCDKYPSPNEPEPIIGLTFCIFLFGMYCLIVDDSTESVGFEKYSHPIPPKKKETCYNNCGNTLPSIGDNKFCLNCGSSIVKRPEFPKDRTRTDKTSWEDRRF